MILRHKRFPVLILYKDPPESWEKIVKDRIIEEIKQTGFDDFVLMEEQKKEPQEQTNE